LLLELLSTMFIVGGAAGVALVVLAGLHAAARRIRKPNAAPQAQNPVDEYVSRLREANSAYEAKEYARALNIMNGILDAHPRDAAVLLVKCRIELATRGPDPVADDARREWPDLPGRGGFAVYLARAYYNQGSLAKAAFWYGLAQQEPDFDDLLTLDHNPTELHMRLGRAEASYA